MRFALGVGLAILLLLGGEAFTRLPMFRLQRVHVLGAHHVSLAQIQLAIQHVQHGNLFSIDLAQVQADFGMLPWVRTVDVRRKWPNELVVTLNEQQPLARWNDNALLNVQGEEFMAASNAKLPHLSGPPGSNVLVAQTWAQVVQDVAPLGRMPVSLSMSERGSWDVVLDNGVRIALGRDNQALARLVRWVQLYPAMQAQLSAPLASVDLRYPQGFAVRLSPVENPPDSQKIQENMS